MRLEFRQSERQEVAPGSSDPVPAVCKAPSRHLLLSQPLGQAGEQGASRAQVQSVCRARIPDSGQDRARQDSPHPPADSPGECGTNVKTPHYAPPADGRRVFGGPPPLPRKALPDPGPWTGNE